MVAAAERGEAPDPEPGIRGKQRSVHNTYFTLPVLYAMTSNHYAMVYAHEYNWLILIAVSLAGTLVRVYFVARHKGRAAPAPLAIAVALLVLVAVAIAPRDRGGEPGAVSLAEARSVIAARCVNCHSATPSHPAFPAAPLGVMLDTDAQIVANADRIYQQTVVTRIMPIGNLTQMTDAERQVIAGWYEGLGETQ
jgi:uncharacterized membrane protein